VTDIEQLVERSVSLKKEILDFARRPQFDSAFRREMRSRFGDPVAAEEDELHNFFDWFIQQYRRPDGRTVVDCFLDTRPALTPDEREFLRGWRDVVEGIFEVTGRDGAVLEAVNLIDDLDYRMWSNIGSAVLDHFPDGSFVVTRVVPLGDEWLISGSPAVFGAERHDEVMHAAAQMATASPGLVFRNPERLARGWELQRAERAAFVEHFGSDQVVLDVGEVAPRLAEFSAKRYPGAAADPMRSITDSIPPWADTVGLIYDETDGLGVYYDLHLVEQAFADPELTRKRQYRETLKDYLTEDGLSPVPLIRLAERDHATADRVFRRLTGKPRFVWSRDGEALLRAHKPEWYDRPSLPRLSVVGERLAAYVSSDR
jgi:hypothetical protein